MLYTFTPQKIAYKEANRKGKLNKMKFPMMIMMIFIFIHDAVLFI